MPRQPAEFGNSRWARTSAVLRENGYRFRNIAISALFDDPDNPLTFIACPEQHAQAVVDGTLRDINDWRGASENPLKHATHGITAIFLKCHDEAILNEAREILRRYAEAVRLDQELTFSVLRRQSTRPGGQEE